MTLSVATKPPPPAVAPAELRERLSALRSLLDGARAGLIAQLPAGDPGRVVVARYVDHAEHALGVAETAVAARRAELARGRREREGGGA